MPADKCKICDLPITVPDKFGRTTNCDGCGQILDRINELDWSRDFSDPPPQVRAMVAARVDLYRGRAEAGLPLFPPRSRS